MGFVDAWVGTLAFSGQIFCDFAGYSTIAIGAALCLGFSIPSNFNYPYAAIGFQDFWRRWHISLSTWLRDYLYIPLGGNRKGSGRTYLNIVITMLLGGLWHGANWTFVAWGGLHAVYLCVERWLREHVRSRLIADHLAVKVALGIFTWLLIDITWVFFRAHSFGAAGQMLAAMAGLHPHAAAMLSTIYLVQGAGLRACDCHRALADA
ncbi:MAG: MBOAT family O-acyltransferase [Steroidobacteraceae bacterium]